MFTRTQKSERLGRLAGLLLVLWACDPVPSAPTVVGPEIDEVDAGESPALPIDCRMPGPGCECEPGTAPVSCHPDPRLGETQRCVSGMRSCRGGVWSACEVGPEGFVEGAAVAALVTGPSQCNPCDPRCYSTSTQPTSPADVDPSNSNGVVVDPIVGGVQLPVTGSYTGAGDDDGDGIPNDFDLFPTDPTRNGYTENGGIFHMLPAGVNAGPDPVAISTTIRTADIYILMDGTGSMAGEIANLRSSLLTGSYLSASVFEPAIPAISPENRTTAYDLGTDPLPGVHPISGNTSSMADDVSSTGCNATGRDAVVRFTLTQPQTVVISTNATWDTVLSLRDSSFTTQIVCNDNQSGSTTNSYITRALAAGTYYVVLEGRNSAARGAFGLSIQFNGASCAGVVGAIKCLIPDAWFGVGDFREIPVTPHGLSYNAVYEHHLDETGDTTLISTAVNALYTQGNVDWPESLSQGLYAAVTGNGLGPYYPARTSNPLFGACPAGRWGYACFRDGTIPIVIAFTDAPTHEGPDPLYDYTLDTRWPAVTDINVSGNDTQATAFDMGDLTTLMGSAQKRIYTGLTSSPIADNYDATVVGCNASARDAVFRFTLTAPRRVQFNTYDARGGFDSVIAIFQNSITAGNRVICNDDIYYSGSRSQITTNLAAGTYYLVVDGYSGATGRYYLNVNGRPVTDGSPPYPSAQFPAYWEYTSHALLSRRVKFIGIRSCSESATGDEGDFCPDTYEALRDIAMTTSSVDTDGSPFVYTISNNGTGLSGAVVNAVQRLASISRMNIQARAVDNPATSFDERNFIYAINITNCPAARCAGPRSGSICGQCLPGTDVGFEVIFRNTGVSPSGVPRQATAQVFDFAFQLVGDDTYILNSVPVRIVVPPILASYPPSGTYWHDFDSTQRCTINEGPLWGTLDWSANVPTGTSLSLQLRAADTQTGLAAASPVTVAIPPSTSPVNAGALLRAAGIPDYTKWVRVTAVLNSNAAMTATPRLDRMALSYTCVPES